MDPRHESRAQEILNQIIELINQLLRETPADVISNPDIKTIAHLIYDYAQMKVDVDDTLAKHNLLSVDMVLLPHIEELITNVSIKPFSQFFASVETVLAKKDGRFYAELREILQS